MKINRLLDRLEPMPMLRILVPFAAGILFAEHFELPLWLTLTGFSVCGAVALLLGSGLYALCTLFLFGVAATEFHRTDSTHSAPEGIYTTYEIVISGDVADRGAFSSADGVAVAWRGVDGKWHSTEERIAVRADSAAAIKAGERIVCRGAVHPFRGGSESYRRLMARRGYSGTLRIAQQQIISRTPESRGNLHLAAAERLARLPMSSESNALCRAMTVGDRSGITPELRTAYARSGMSHLLAVSGLHVGIVFALVNLLLWWVPLLRRGHIVRNIAAAACIWLYAATAGFPPSAVRAAIMFSMLQFALASASTYKAGNILAAAAFGMLAYNPNYLNDISFQLSFVAVAAILAWGVPLCRKLRTGYKAADIPLAMLAIGAVSTLATAPLVSHTFGTIPLAGVALNPLAIALAAVIVLTSAIWTLLPFAPLAEVLGWMAGSAARLLNALAEWVAAIPCAAIEYTLPGWATAAIYLFFVAATAAAWMFEPKKSVHLPR